MNIPHRRCREAVGYEGCHFAAARLVRSTASGQRGDSIDHTPTADVAAGDIVKLGNLVGIAKLDIKSGELGALALTGVYEVAKGDAVFAAGDEVGWDATNKKAVLASTAGCVKIGYAIAAAASGNSLVNVRLEQGL